MKKLLTPVSCLVLPLFVAVLLRPSPAQGGATQGQETAGLEQRVSALESQLATERKQHQETRALLEETITYLGSHAKAAQSLLGTLDESQQQGFTVGENWRSRETLLNGLRSYWSDAQKGLPVLPPPQARTPAQGTRAPAKAPVRSADQ